jgi:Na+-translocating ferredoxin:NAD+ oxidoreductase RnfA subunit
MNNEILIIIISCLFTSNIVFSQFLGICSVVGVSNKIKNAVNMGIVVTIVMLLSSIICYGLYVLVLSPLNLTYLVTICDIFIIAGLTQILEIILKNHFKNIYDSFGIYLPLVSTNCAILGVALTTSVYTSFLKVLIYSLFSGLGYLLAIFLVALVRTKLNFDFIPKCFKGLPITLIICGIIAMIFSCI